MVSGACSKSGSVGLNSAGILTILATVVAITACSSLPKDPPTVTPTNGSTQGAHSARAQAASANRCEEPAATDSDSSTCLVSFETNQGTFISVDVSPDGETLVFDLLGDLYLLDAHGGEAIALTRGPAWDRAPIFSQVGHRVFFVSDREGYENLWQINLTDRTLEQITHFTHHARGLPNRTPDGDVIFGVGFGERGLETVLNAIDPADGSARQVAAPSGAWFDYDTFRQNRARQIRYSGVQQPNGSIYFAEGRFNPLGRPEVRLYRHDPGAEEVTALTAEGAAHSDYLPQISHTGRMLAFFRQHPDRTTQIWLRDLDDDSERMLVELGETDDASITASQETRPNYAFTPDDRFLVLSHDGGLVRVDIETGTIADIPFQVTVALEVARRAEPPPQRLDVTTIRPNTIRWPDFAPGSDELIYAAMGYLWLENLAGGQTRKLTGDRELVYMPALSPDGSKIAYVAFEQRESGYGEGSLKLFDLESGHSVDLLIETDAHFLIPRWSQDGARIAAIREVRTAEGLVAHYGWTDILEPRFNIVDEAPSSQTYLAATVFSRFVGFDEDGRRLLFSDRVSQDETRLVAVHLDDGLQTVLATGLDGVWGIVPSPDLSRLAFVRSDETVWILPLGESDQPVRFTADDSAARRISPIAGYYPDWISNHELSFGYGRTVYRYSIDEQRLTSVQPGASVGREMNSSPIAFRGARIVTMVAAGQGPQIIESGTIMMEDGRISAIGPKAEIPIPAAAVSIDVTGRTIIPGLIESHYHRIGGSGGIAGLSAFKLPNQYFVDESALGYGVTTAWEPGGVPNDAAPSVTDLQAAGRIAGPRWSYAASGGVGYPVEYLNSFAAAQAAVQRHKALGVTVLKEYLTPTRQQQHWLAEAARAENLGIIAHIDNFDGMMTRIIDGYSGGEHAYIPAPFYRDVAELMRQTGFVWTPNIDISVGIIGATRTLGYFWNEVLRDDPEAGRKLESLATGSRFLPERLQLREFEVPLETHRISWVARQAAEAAKHGIRVAMSAHGMPGARLHSEMWYLWRGGADALDVLRAATMVNAEKLGLQNEVGSLEAGKIADFLILEDNPLDDVLDTLSIEYTIQGGVIYDADNAERITAESLQRRLAADRPINHEEAPIQTNGKHD